VAVLTVQNLCKSYEGEEIVAGAHVPVQLAYAAGGFYAATVLFRRRLLK